MYKYSMVVTWHINKTNLLSSSICLSAKWGLLRFQPFYENSTLRFPLNGYCKVTTMQVQHLYNCTVPFQPLSLWNFEIDFLKMKHRWLVHCWTPNLSSRRQTEVGSRGSSSQSTSSSDIQCPSDQIQCPSDQLKTDPVISWSASQLVGWSALSGGRWSKKCDTRIREWEELFFCAITIPRSRIENIPSLMMIVFESSFENVLHCYQ